MANKTAMQVLKSKIQDAIGEINGELNLYSSGYKQCLINIQNDIDAQMMEMEKEQLIDAHIEGQRVFDKHPHTQWTNDQAELYYNETYGKTRTTG